MRNLVKAGLPILLLAAWNSAAQNVLSGSVQQNAPSNIEVQTTVLDMFHQLSIMSGNATTSQQAQQRYQADIGKFSSYVSSGSPLAQQLSPCVQKYQQAYPHVVQESRYYMQNNTKAFNAEASIADPLLSAGVNCMNRVTGDEYNVNTTNNTTQTPPQNSGQIPYNPYVPNLPNPTPSNPSGSPRAGSPGGNPSNPVYQGGAGSDPCRPFGAGGYDYCANPTQPAGCYCPRKLALKQPAPPAPAPPASNPITDTLDYMRGLAAGIGNCIKGTFDLLGAAGQMMRGDFSGAAQTMGLQPGQSVVLRAFYQELVATRSVGASAYELGFNAGRRLCAYGAIPGSANVLGKLPKMLRSGGMARNALNDAAILNTPPENLPGNYIQTPWGPKRIGPMVGKGASGSVYRLPDEPGNVIKLGNANPDSAPSFGRQMDGYNRLTQSGAGVATPGIRNFRLGGPSQPSMIIAQDIFSQWPGAQIVPELGNITAAQLNAIQNLYNQLATKGMIWVDGHTSNIFFANGNGGLIAGMVETDGLLSGNSWNQFRLNDPTQTMKAAAILQEAGMGSVLFNNFSPQSIMNALFKIRFGDLFSSVGASR